MPDWTLKNFQRLRDQSPREAPEEAYVVVAGSGRAKLDDELVELTAWDVLRVAPAVVRSFEAGPEGLDLICIGGRKPKGGDTERVPDFWD